MRAPEYRRGRRAGACRSVVKACWAACKLSAILNLESLTYLCRCSLCINYLTLLFTIIVFSFFSLEPPPTLTNEVAVNHGA
jgi:hypothetical protein